MDSPSPLSSWIQCSILWVGRNPGANWTRRSNPRSSRVALGTWLYPSGPQLFTLKARWKWSQLPAPGAAGSALLWAAKGAPFLLRLSSASRWREGVGWEDGDRQAGLFPPHPPGPGSTQLQLRTAPARLVEACYGSILTLTPGPPPLALQHCLLPVSLGSRDGGSFLSFFKAFYWSIVSLHCCVTFFCAAKWIHYPYTHIHSFWVSSPFRSPPSTEWGPCLYDGFSLVICFIHGRVCMSVPISQFIPAPFSTWYLYICSPRLCVCFSFTNRLTCTTFLDFTCMC